MIITFGEYAPDQVAAGAPNVLEGAYNVVPTATGYQIADGFTSRGVTSIPAYTHGCFEARYGAGLADQFLGTSGAIYRIASGDTTAADVSKVGGYVTLTDTEYWRFAQFGDVIIAVNGGDSGADAPQAWTLNSSSAFANLGGSPPKAAHVAVIRDFVVFGHTYDSTDGEQPTRVRWSGFGDQTAWTISPATQSDLQDLKTDGGRITGVVGGESGIILQERAVSLMRYEGPPTVFRFDQIPGCPGCIKPRSVVVHNGAVYYLSTSGFVQLNPGGAWRIVSDQRNTRTTAEPANADGTIVIGVSSPAHNYVAWMTRDTTTTGGTVLHVYYPLMDRWTTFGLSTNQHTTFNGFDAFTSSYADSLGRQYASLTAPAGSGLWTQAAGNAGAKVCQLQTGAVMNTDGLSFVLTKIRPLMRAPVSVTHALTVSSRHIATDSDTSSQWFYNSTTGDFNGRNSGKQATFLLTITMGGTTASGQAFDIVGLKVTGMASGGLR